ncbi:MAG: primosomal protein N', partial [Clostridiales bacterium]|nr:primosomal protein N' [Clostridiales bacterium]
IIIDEEHESSYKSDYTPKYDTIDTAKKRAEINNAVLILGSATPTVISYYKSQIGEYDRIELKERYNKTPMPLIEVVDMREELQLGNKSIFSKKLYDAMKQNLKAGKQVILFLNRRGYASFVSCRSCGYVVKCPSCGISMTYHFNSQTCVCHYCGHENRTPERCPECSSKYIKFFGVGTEKVEAYVKEIFPDHTCARLDLDTSSKKGSAQKILGDFKRGKTDILIGTQIIAKGLDFPNVGLVGVIAADISLNIADYRASERTFQLITQAAGRSGRGTERGIVIVQTYKPEHYAVITASGHDYHSFYENEILMRSQLEYPPFTDIMQIIISGKDEKGAGILADKIVSDFIRESGTEVRNQILGPRPAPRQKINDRFRFQILIKCKPVDRIQFKGIINNIKNDFRDVEQKGYGITIDINPYSFM